MAKRPKGHIYKRAAEEIGLSRDKVLYRLVKEVAITTNTTLDLTEYIIAYYLWYIKYQMRGSNFPKIRVPYFGSFTPSLKNIRLSLKLLLKSYKYGKIGRLEFVKLFRYHWLIYKTIMDRTYGKHAIWRAVAKKKLNEYRIAIIGNPDRKRIYQLAMENPEYFDELRDKIITDKKNKTLTSIDDLEILLKKQYNKL